MLVKDIKFTGIHADIIKKYSRVRDPNDLVAHVQFLSYAEKKLKDDDLILFDTYFNAFITSALVGMKNKKKVKMDQGPNKSASIFAEILAKNSSVLRKLYQYYVFSQSNNENINESIKKAFSADISSEEINLFSSDILEYSCGGLEIIEKLFHENHFIEDIIISINELIA